MTSDMYQALSIMTIDLFVKMMIIWVILSVAFVSLWAIVRGVQKNSARAKILWAIGLGSKSVDEIVEKTHLQRDDVEDVLEDLKVE